MGRVYISLDNLIVVLSEPLSQAGQLVGKKSCYGRNLEQSCAAEFTDKDEQKNKERKAGLSKPSSLRGTLVIDTGTNILDIASQPVRVSQT